jgi:DNA-binding transcriptional MocR family regulator
MSTKTRAAGAATGSDRVLAALRAAVARAAPHERLPSVRELVAQHRASPVPVQRALSQLVREGLVVARPGSGSFVADRAASAARPLDPAWQTVVLGAQTTHAETLREHMTPPPPGMLPLASGYLDASLQPIAALSAAAARAARRPGVWDRVPVEGVDGLRAWFAREAGGGVRPNDVLIVPGGQAAIATVIRATAAPGAAMLVESPTYLGAIVAARSAGVRLVPVPTDDDGVRPDLLEEAFAASGARLVYLQPCHANPTGAVLSPARHAAVLAAAARAGAFVIEDDFARDLTIDGDPPPRLVSADDAGRVIGVRSLSKSAAPGLRIAAVSARGPVASRLQAARVVEDLFVAGPLQETALELLTNPSWPRHLRALRQALRVRRDAAVEAVRTGLPMARLRGVPRGGTYLWVELPEGQDDVAIARAAAAAGVLVTAGRAWFPAEPTGAFLRLSYAAADPETFREGVRRLAGVLRAAR